MTKVSKKSDLCEEKVLRRFSMPPVSVTVEEARHDGNTTSVEDFDESFLKALRERESEEVCVGYGEIQHPTSRLFEIGIDSVRAGKPSELFLLLLEEIGRMAEERDVMAELFPETFPRRIKTSSVRAVQRDAKIVEAFKSHLRRYLDEPKTAKVTGDEDKGGSWTRVERTYAEAIAKYKRRMNPDQKKALDRALRNQGDDIIQWRDEISRARKSNLAS